MQEPLTKPIPNYIGGQWVSSSGTESLEILDPASAEFLGRVPLSTRVDVENAVAAAAKAFPDWRRTPAAERVRVLFRLRALVAGYQRELAETLTREHGKVLPESLGEIQRGMDSLEHACAVPSLMMGDTLENVGPGIDCETIRQPLGVFAAITPYNFPIMIPMWFWPYAVATGNTFVLKPSEQDALTHQRILDLATEAGLPPGVLNVVHGGVETVEAILAHPDISGVSFVGSSATARIVYSGAAAHGKRVQALGGAKNHMVVMPDADLNQVSDALISSIFGSTGQRCLAGSVVVGVGDAYAPLRQQILERSADLRLGHGLDEDTDMGPLISSSHRERVVNYIERGAREGADLLLDGRNATVPAHPRGNWLGPTVFDRVAPEMSIGSEEIFGPVAALTQVGSLDEAIDLIHKNRYGNAVSIFTQSGGAAREFRHRAGISMIGVNIGVAAPMAMFPFGGSRGSFFGDLKAQGRDAVGFYTDQRVVISKW